MFQKISAFNQHLLFLSLALALYTCPYVPSPIWAIISNTSTQRSLQSSRHVRSWRLAFNILGLAVDVLGFEGPRRGKGGVLSVSSSGESSSVPAITATGKKWTSRKCLIPSYPFPTMQQRTLFTFCSLMAPTILSMTYIHIQRTQQSGILTWRHG